MMDFVCQLIDWFLSENLLQFRRTKIERKLSFVATSLSNFQNSSAAVMKKTSCATDVFVTMITNSHAVIISFMD